MQGSSSGASPTPAKFGVTFQAITPSKTLTNATWSLGNSIAWTALPALDPSSIKASLGTPGLSSLAGVYPQGSLPRIYPVTLTALLAETKDPNVYLQALSGAFNQQAQTQVGTAIANNIPFGGMPSVDAQAQVKTAGALLTDKAAASSALATLLKDCSNVPTAHVDLQILILKEQQANLDATLAGQSPPYPDPGADGRLACPAA